MSSPPVSPSKGGKKAVNGDGDGDGGTSRPVAVVERVITNSSAAVELPMLTRSNYYEWSVVMQVSMEAMGLWDIVEADKAERREDRLALSAILRAVPSEMKAGLAKKKTAKEAWAAVKTMRMGDKRVKEANAQRFLKEFENVAFRDGESIDDFTQRVNGIVGNLRELGEEVEDSRVVKKVLRVLPKKYNQIACSIEMLMDLNDMSIEELVGRLRVAEEKYGAVEEVADSAGHLLLTEEQWNARRRQCGGKERGRGGEKGGGRSGGHDDKDDDDVSSTSSGASRRHRGRCFNCGERGHIKRNCPKPTKEKALLAVADSDDEPCLL